MVCGLTVCHLAGWIFNTVFVVVCVWRGVVVVCDRSHYVAPAGRNYRQGWSVSQTSTCFCLQSAGLKDVCHHT